MKKKRFRSASRYTFLVLPDDGGPSVRFRASTFLLAAIPILMLALAATASTLYLLQERSTWRMDRLHQQFDLSSGAYKSEIAFKDASIQQLQKQVVAFAQQAEDVQTRLDQLDKLASAMKSFVGIQEPSGSKVQADQPDEENGVGGEFFAATDNDYRQLIDGMDEKYADLNVQIGELKEALTRTHTEVQKKKQQLRVMPTFWPTYSQRITSLFGVRIDPFTGNPAKHTGIDIAGSFADPVFAAADGTVAETGYNNARGNYVFVRHKQGILTKYMHLLSISVSKGDVLKQGDTVGKIGSTGRSTGPHLHFEVLEHDVPVDPKPYLNMAMKGMPTDVQVLEKRQD